MSIFEYRLVNNITGWSNSGSTISDISEHTLIKAPPRKPIRRKSKGPQYPCTHIDCSSVFSRPYRLAAHLKVHAGEKPFPCKAKDCNKAYTNNAHLARHIKTAHSSSKGEPIKEFRCIRCPNVYTNAQNLRKHNKTHDQAFPYKCTFCDLGFLKKNLLAAHIFLHTGINQFKCDLCDKTFPNQSERYKHRHRHKEYTCVVCGLLFSRWTDLIKHRRDVHQINEFQCDICKKRFKSKQHIARHMKIHSTPDDTEVFPCPYTDCPKFYSFKYNLIHHVKYIHEKVTFNCTVDGCGAKLSTQDKLNEHVQKHKNPAIKIKRKKQTKRKDIGTMKRSSAVKLSGLKLPFATERDILDGNNISVNLADFNEESEHRDCFDPFTSDFESYLSGPNAILISTETIIK